MNTLPTAKRTHPPRWIALFPLFAMLAVLPPALASASEEFLLTVRAGAYTIEPVRQEERSFRRVVASLPGRTSDPGLPSLPFRTFLVGVPDGARVFADVVSSDYTDIPGDPIQPAGRDTIMGRDPVAVLLPAFDEETYRSAEWHPGQDVEVGPVGRLRRQTVAPIRVHTFRTIPSTGALRVYDEMVVRIRIETDGAKGPGALLAEPSGEEPLWENLYGRMIANYDQAKAHRTRGPGVPRLRKNAGNAPEWKISVRESGLYRIDFEELASAGFPDGMETGSIALARRDFSESELAAGRDPFTERILPTQVGDEDANGFFGPGDRLFAYLPGFRDDRMKRENDDRFASEAVYFLTTAGEGRPFEKRAGWRGYPGLSPAASFPDSIRWEVDVFYEFQTPAESLDVYYPFRNIKDYDTLRVDLPEPDPLASVQVKAMTVSNVTDFPYHRYMLVLEATGDTVFNEVVTGTIPALRTSAITGPASVLSAGANRLIYYGFRGPSPGNTYVPGAGGLFDWFEIRTSYLYRAVDGYLRFSTGKESGRLQMDLAGFADPDVLVLDVVDPYAPVLVEADSVRSDGGTYTVLIQDSTASTRPYVASTREGARRLEKGKIVRDEPSGLASGEADYLIVAHDDFFDATARLAEYRESQGLRVARARVSDVYDEFNGGVKDPIAIQRYFRYAFEQWRTQPTFALLVGDGYEDYRGIGANRSPEDTAAADYIPSRPFLRRSPGEGNNWYASDSWFVLLDGLYDLYPEMFIGRFPAGSEEEVEALTEKTIAYETGRREEPWRRRVLFLADDAWVKDSAFYPYHDGRQDAFETGSLDLAKRVTNQSALRADTTNFFLSRFTDVYHPLCPYQGQTNPTLADHMCVIGLTRDPIGGATPRLFDFLNGPGASLLNYQGHGNRTSLTHELLLIHGKDTAYTGTFFQDLTDHVSPGSPPYILFAYGCSISEFDAFFSFGFDALCENAVLLPETGAVMTYGSTDLEFLDQNLDLNEFILDCWFPTLEGSRAARTGDSPRTAGEVLTSGMGGYTAATDDFGPLRRYVMLGDPALRIGPDEPSLVVTAGGDTVASGATRLPPSDGSAWEFEARLLGDVLVTADNIRVLENGTAIDDSLYTVEAGVDSATNRWSWTVRRERPQDTTFREVAFRFVDLWGVTTSHVLHTYADVALSIDGVAYEESLAVPSSTRLRINIGADVPLSLQDFRVEAAGTVFPADTLYRTSDTTWAAEADLVLPSGPVDLRVSLGGLSWTFPVRVTESGILITAAVDGVEAASGYSLLGHLDGTPPVIIARVENLPGTVIDSIRVLEGEAPVSTDLYEIEPDTIDGRAFRRVTYRPELRNDGDDIRIEVRVGSVAAAFLFRASIPILLTIDGTTVADGDYVAGRSEVRAVATYAGALPPGEATFLLDDAAVPADTLRREGTDRWIAAAAIEPPGGSHTVAFRAGAFSASRSVRVENRLRVLDPLCHPNPVGDRTGFYYHLTCPADEVRVEIFTITGRRIRVLESLSARAGFNENPGVWDGRDQDGDRLARGAYPFRVVASRAGEKAESVGKIVIGDDRE